MVLVKIASYDLGDRSAQASSPGRPPGTKRPRGADRGGAPAHPSPATLLRGSGATRGADRRSRLGSHRAHERLAHERRSAARLPAHTGTRPGRAPGDRDARLAAPEHGRPRNRPGAPDEDDLGALVRPARRTGAGSCPAGRPDAVGPSRALQPDALRVVRARFSFAFNSPIDSQNYVRDPG